MNLGHGGAAISLALPVEAFLMGAERVIAIDHFPHRLELARKFGAETINFEQSKVYEALQEMTGGIGPDATMDCVGLEAHGAFAHDDTSGRYGASWNQASQARADEAALKGCASESCKIVFRTAARQCGAIAMTENGKVWGGATRPERGAAA